MSFRRKLTAASVSTHSRPKAAATGKKFRTFGKQFQHTAARRRLQGLKDQDKLDVMFQHTAARRRLLSLNSSSKRAFGFQHTAARRRLPPIRLVGVHYIKLVSTHSRPKAAATSTTTPLT